MNVSLDFLTKNNNKTFNPFRTTQSYILLKNLCYEFFSDTDEVISYNPHNCQLEDELSYHYKMTLYVPEIEQYIMWRHLTESPDVVTKLAAKYAEAFVPKMINHFYREIPHTKSWHCKAAIKLLCDMSGRYNPVSKMYDPYMGFDLSITKENLANILKINFENITFHLDEGESTGAYAFCNNVNLSQIDQTMNFLSRYDNWFFITKLNKKIFSKMQKNKALLLNSDYYPVDNIENCKNIMIFHKA